jgi:hypothetical protein
MNMPEFERPVSLSAGCVTTNGGVTSDYISLKGVHEVFIVATLTSAVGHASVVALKQATAVAGTGVKALANAVPVWMIADVTATDLYTRQTDAVSQAIGATAKTHKVVFKVKASDLDGANDFDVLGVSIATSSQATNFCCIDAIIVPRYGAKSVITD